MKVLESGEILPPHIFDQVRDVELNKVAQIRRDRRIEVGPFTTLNFETRETIKFQVQELLRMGKSQSRINDELEVFNQLIPGQNELTATLVLSLTDENDLREWLEGVMDSDLHIFLKVGDEMIRARNIVTHSAHDTTTQVRHVRFYLPEKIISKFEGSEVSIHNHVGQLKFARVLEKSQKAALLQDLQTK